jgi:hypothetical protein
MRRHVLLACLTIAFAVPVFPGVAHADDAAVVEAKARFEEGLELADAGKAEPARLKFQQAWAVFKAPAVLYNLARAEQLTGHDLEALEHFKLFLKVGATDVKITDAMRDKAKQNAAELAKKVGQVDIEVPPTARVSVDGKPLEETPKDPVAVQPGRHTIEASFDGRVKSVTVECLAGNVVKARIEFESGGGTEPPGEQAHGFWTTGRVVGLSAAVVGLAALGTGVAFGLSAGSKHDDADAKRATLPDPNSSCSFNPALPQCSELKSLESDYKSASTLSTVFLASGGVLVVGGAVLFLVSAPKRNEPTRGMRFVPMASSKEAGVSWMGTF